MSTSYTMQVLSAAGAGLLFGQGLIISRMIDPIKVMDFLDFTGNWDASLAFVMLGAIIVTSVGYRILFKSERPLFADLFRLPVSKDIDFKLLSGAVLFGVGWGLAGLCPGPALVNFSLGISSVLLFVISMVMGINGYRLIQSLSTQSKSPSNTQ